MSSNVVLEVKRKAKRFAISAEEDIYLGAIIFRGVAIVTCKLSYVRLLDLLISASSACM